MQETTTIQEDERTRYELTVLMIGEELAAVRDLLKKHGASIEDDRPAEKIRLAYPISKQPYAFMGSVRFTVDKGLPSAPQVIANVREGLKISIAPLRFLIHQVRGADAPSGERVGERPEAIREPRQSLAESAEPLTNEALEKKISEILQ